MALMGGVIPHLTGSKIMKQPAKKIQENLLDKTILYGRMIETQASDTDANERNRPRHLTSDNQLCILVVEFWLG